MDTGEKAAGQLRKQSEYMKERLDGLVVEAMRVAQVVGEMSTMVKKGEESGKSLGSFIKEVKNKLERK